MHNDLFHCNSGQGSYYLSHSRGLRSAGARLSVGEIYALRLCLLLGLFKITVAHGVDRSICYARPRPGALQVVIGVVREQM